MSKIEAQSGKIQQRGRPREFNLEHALETAMEVFWKQGYMQSPLNDLCAAMGIKPPSFYCAFGTRENLFLETLKFYMDKYWSSILQEFSEEPDIRTALRKLLENAVKIYMRPNLPKGCFRDVSTVGLSPGEKRIADTLAFMDGRIRETLRKRLMRAIDDGQLPPESDVPAISGAMMAFLKGVAAMARTDICQAELAGIASYGLFLLPAKQEIRA